MRISAAGRRSMPLFVALGAALLGLVSMCPGRASAEDKPSDSSQPPLVVAADSPRAALVRYLELARAGQFAEAAKYLQVPASRQREATALAERLKVVLDRNIWFEMDRISPQSKGNLNDGLSPDAEDVASIAGPGGVVDPVRLVRIKANEGGHWVFSAATVERIDLWYSRLGDRWIRDHLPAALLRPGPRELLWWQWMALPALLALAWVLGKILGWITRRALDSVFKRTRTEWDDVLLQKMAGPLTLVWGLAAVFVLLPWLSLYEPAEMFIHRIMRAAFYLSFFWAMVRAVDVAAQFLATSSWGTTHQALGAFIPLGVRIVKVVVVAMAAIAILSELGYPVASLIAGLGIGGLALALAAQKTVENLFGSVSLGVDQPIRVGDFVKVEDFVGTVESIGLRSTRIRTLDRTVVSYPNGKLADMRLETFAPRERIRLTATVGVVYGTSEAQMRTIVTGFEGALKAHPKVWQDAIRVVFIGFGDSSLNIECLCWFETADFGEFCYLRQDVMLQLMKIVEDAGSSFAFPTRTLHLVNDSDPELPAPQV